MKAEQFFQRFTSGGTDFGSGMFNAAMIERARKHPGRTYARPKGHYISQLHRMKEGKGTR